MKIDFEKLAEKNFKKLECKERPTIVAIIDLFIEAGLFMNRSDFIRRACEEKIEKTIELLGKAKKEDLVLMLSAIPDDKLDKIERLIELIASIMP